MDLLQSTSLLDCNPDELVNEEPEPPLLIGPYDSDGNDA